MAAVVLNLLTPHPSAQLQQQECSMGLSKGESKEAEACQEPCTLFSGVERGPEMASHLHLVLIPTLALSIACLVSPTHFASSKKRLQHKLFDMVQGGEMRRMRKMLKISEELFSKEVLRMYIHSMCSKQQNLCPRRRQIFHKLLEKLSS